MPDPTEPVTPSAPVRISDNTRPEWGTVARWQRDSNAALLAHALEDLAELPRAQAEALAAALLPLDQKPHVAIVDDVSAIVSRADLERLADRSQHAGPEMDHAWREYRAADAESLTAWQAFVAGIRAASRWTGA